MTDIEIWEKELEPIFNIQLKRCESYREVYQLMETINPEHKPSHKYMDWVVENWIDNCHVVRLPINQEMINWWNYKNRLFNNR